MPAFPEERFFLDFIIPRPEWQPQGNVLRKIFNSGLTGERSVTTMQGRMGRRPPQGIACSRARCEARPAAGNERRRRRMRYHTGTSSLSWRRSQKTNTPLPCTEAWALRNTAEIRRASAPGSAGGRRSFSCGWSWTDNPPNRPRRRTKGWNCGPLQRTAFTDRLQAPRIEAADR